MSSFSVWRQRLWLAMLAAMLASALGSVAVKLCEIVRGLDRYESLVMADNLPYSPIGEILPGMVYRQPFVPIANGLDRIRIHVATYARQNSSGLQFRLLDAAGKELVRRVIPPTLDEREFFIMTFDPLPDTAGRTFVMELTATASRPGDAMTVWGTKQIPAGYWSAKLAGRDIDSVLRFDYSARRHLDVSTIARRMGQYKPLVFKRPYNLGLALGLPLLMLVLTVVIFRVARGAEKPPSVA